MSQSVREADNQLLLFYEAQLKFGFIVFLLHNYRLRPLHVGALYRMLSEGGRKEILKSNKKKHPRTYLKLTQKKEKLVSSVVIKSKASNKKKHFYVK